MPSSTLSNYLDNWLSSTKSQQLLGYAKHNTRLQSQLLIMLMPADEALSQLDLDFKRLTRAIIPIRERSEGLFILEKLLQDVLSPFSYHLLQFKPQAVPIIERWLTRSTQMRPNGKTPEASLKQWGIYHNLLVSLYFKLLHAQNYEQEIWCHHLVEARTNNQLLDTDFIENAEFLPRISYLCELLWQQKHAQIVITLALKFRLLDIFDSFPEITKIMSAEHKLTLIEIYLKNNQLLAARQLIEQFSKIQMRSVNYAHRMLDILLAENREREAIKWAENAFARHPESRFYQRLLAIRAASLETNNPTANKGEKPNQTDIKNNLAENETQVLLPNVSFPEAPIERLIVAINNQQWHMAEKTVIKLTQNENRFTHPWPARRQLRKMTRLLEPHSPLGAALLCRFFVEKDLVEQRIVHSHLLANFQRANRLLDTLVISEAIESTQQFLSRLYTEYWYERNWWEYIAEMDNNVQINYQGIFYLEVLQMAK